MWLSILLVSGVATARVLLSSLSQLKSQSTSYSVETDYLYWRTIFPAVVLCEAYDADKMEELFKENKVPVALSSLYNELLFTNPVQYCRSCSDQSVDIGKLVSIYRGKCKDILGRCWWNDEPFECCDKFKPVSSQYGECYAFNSLQSDELNSNPYSVDRMQPLARLHITVMESVMIDIFTPDDVVIVEDREIKITFPSEFYYRFKIEDTYSDDGVRSLPIRQRGCRFSEEMPPEMRQFPRYSYSACILQCRTDAQMQHCNCTHHYMPQIDGYPSCDIQGLKCLTKMQAGKRDDDDSKCNCLPSCEEGTYLPIKEKNIHNTGALTNELIARGSLVTVELDSLPTLRIRQQNIRSMLGFVVNIGGIIGVFFGASILSAVEIIYLLFIRKY